MREREPPRTPRTPRTPSSPRRQWTPRTPRSPRRQWTPRSGALLDILASLASLAFVAVPTSQRIHGRSADLALARLRPHANPLLRPARGPRHERESRSSNGSHGALAARRVQRHVNQMARPEPLHRAIAPARENASRALVREAPRGRAEREAANAL